MNQDDIFRLLLIILLSANRQLDELNAKAEANAAAAAEGIPVTNQPRFSYTSVNDLLILAMFLRLFDFTRDPACTPNEGDTTTF